MHLCTFALVWQWICLDFCTNRYMYVTNFTENVLTPHLTVHKNSMEFFWNSQPEQNITNYALIQNYTLLVVWRVWLCQKLGQRFPTPSTASRTSLASHSITLDPLESNKVRILHDTWFFYDIFFKWNVIASMDLPHAILVGLRDSTRYEAPATLQWRRNTRNP